MESAPVDPRTTRILVSGFILLGLSIYNFATYTSTTTFQSTFSLQPGLANTFSDNLNPSDSVSGTFQEVSGMPVSFYILSSAQYAAHQANGPFTFLYSIANVASGSFSYTATVQDLYYLFFSHGSGLTNTTETVFAVRNWTIHIDYRAFLGIFFLVAAAADFYFAYRSNKKASSVPSTVPPWTPPTIPSSP